MVPGTTGKMLWVDLSSGTTESRDIPDDAYRNYLGGYAVAEALAAREQAAGADALGEDNILSFSVGLLAGTGVPFSGRFMVSGKSPTTGGVGESNAGGDLAPAMKKSGFDIISVRGRAETPVVLVIEDGKAQIKDAAPLWGLDTVATDAAVKELAGGKRVKVACIGPAGENRSLMAGVVNDGARIAARMGMGAVMGAKGLKAVALSGSGKVAVHDREKLRRVTRDFMKKYKSGAVLDKLGLGKIAGPLGCVTGWCLQRLGIAIRQDYRLMRSLMKVYGTAGFAGFSMLSGDAPVKNWKGEAWKEFPLKRTRRITDESILAIESKKYHCAACPLGCGGELSVPEGFRALPGCHKPEYETLASMGSLLLMDDLEPLVAMNDLANRAGMDTISLGGVLAYAAECVESGALSSTDVDGLDLSWGNGDGMLSLAQKIVAREGIGDCLADGVKVAAQKIGRGSDEFAVHAGGVELPMHDPRADPGYGVAYVGDAAPGKHTSSLTFTELFQLDKVWDDAPRQGMFYRKRSRFDPESVGRLTSLGNAYFHLTSCAGLCIFGALTSGATWPLFDWVNAATGWDMSPDAFKDMGLRIVNMRWALNKREGVGIRDFGLKGRAVGQPGLAAGPNRGVTLDMDAYARSFFDVMGWDYEAGVPRPDAMDRCGLPEDAKRWLNGADAGSV